MPIERVSQGFKDISMTFQSNPLNSDLIAIKNENAIARSLRKSLFENIDDITATVIVDEIRESIIRYEPRVELDSVRAYPDYENNSFDVIIVYSVIGSQVPRQELQFVLQSSR